MDHEAHGTKTLIIVSATEEHRNRQEKPESEKVTTGLMVNCVTILSFYFPQDN